MTQVPPQEQGALMPISGFVRSAHVAPKFAAGLAAAICACGAPAPVAHADPGRELDHIIGFTYRTDDTQTGIEQEMLDGFRPISIQRTPSGDYDWVGVRNQDAYATAEPDALYIVDESQLRFTCALTTRRPIDINPFDGGTEMRFAAALVDNDGAEQRDWDFAFGLSQAGVIAWLAQHPTLRAIDVDFYSFNGQNFYSVLAVENTDNLQTWVYYNQTQAQVSTLLAQNNGRLVDIAVTDAITPRFTVVMVPRGTVGWWWYFGLRESDIDFHVPNNGARLIHLHRYSTPSGIRFAVIMNNNSTDLTLQVGELMRNATDGNVGCMLKRVDLPAYTAALQVQKTFEPASTLKILYATHSVDRAAAGTISLDSTFLNNDDRCNPTECPIENPAACNGGLEPLATVIRRVMEQSDNNATYELELFSGRANLNAYAGGLQMPETQINHTIGCVCGRPNNQMSLRDVNQIYSQIADGSLFSSTFQDRLYDLMNDSRDNTDGNYNRLRTIINQEAASTNLTTGEIIDFTERCWLASKAGSYSCTTADGTTSWRSEGGWIRVPYRVANLIPSREWTLGTFVDGATNHSNSAVAYDAFEELIRVAVRPGLESWDAACTPPVVIDTPDSIERIVGGTAEFHVGLGLGVGTTTFQWRRNAAPLVNGVQPNGSVISGADTATLTISNLAGTSAGAYTCRVTRECGTFLSSAGILTIVACAADINADGSLDADDLSDYINCYFSVPPCADADVNADGAVNADDLGDYINAYFAGC